MLHDMFKREWIRLVDDDGRYVGSIDAVSGIFMTVRRGGTATFDLPTILSEWHKSQGGTVEVGAKGAQGK